MMTKNKRISSIIYAAAIIFVLVLIVVLPVRL